MSDPKKDPKKAWDDVGEGFRTLGRKVRAYYEAKKAEPEEEAPDREAVENALRTIADSIDEALTSVGNAARDPEIQQDAKNAFRKLGDALATTVDDIAEQIRTRGKGDDTEEPPGPPSKTTP